MKIQNINKMTARDICKYLNSGYNTLPVIMKHSEGYSFYSKNFIKENITLKQAIKLMEEEESYNKLCNKYKRKIVL